MEQQHRNPTYENLYDNDQNQQIPQNSSLPDSRTTENKKKEGFRTGLKN